MDTQKTCDSKRLFKSEIQAACWAGILEFKYKKTYRWYRCPFCRCFHLSTLDKTKNPL